MALPAEVETSMLATRPAVYDR